MYSIDAMQGGQAQYYLSLVTEYYVGQGERAGEWLGEGARRLNLTGTITQEDSHAFRALFQGFSPESGAKLVQNAGKTEGERARVPGWDVCWSMPKSCSLAWSLGSDSLRSQIEAVQAEAVQAGLAFLEARTFSRQGKGGKERVPVKLVAAAFPHFVSRENEPQVHTHTCVLNLATRPDGSTGAIGSKHFYDLQHEAGQVYMQGLAAGMARLGFHPQWHEEEKWFEIAGMPRELLAGFSHRSEQIHAKLAEWGVSGAQEAERAALSSRKPKKHAPLHELLPAWQKAAAEKYGVTPDFIDALRVGVGIEPLASASSPEQKHAPVLPKEPTIQNEPALRSERATQSDSLQETDHLTRPAEKQERSAMPGELDAGQVGLSAQAESGAAGGQERRDGSKQEKPPSPLQGDREAPSPTHREREAPEGAARPERAFPQHSLPASEMSPHSTPHKARADSGSEAKPQQTVASTGSEFWQAWLEAQAQGAGRGGVSPEEIWRRQAFSPGPHHHFGSPVYLLTHDALKQAVSGALEHKSHFTVRELETSLFKSLVAQDIPLHFIRPVLTDFIGRRTRLLGRENDQEIFTTKGLAKREDTLLANMATLLFRRKHVSTALAVQAALTKGSVLGGVTLTEEQHRALHFVTRTRGDIKILGGGSGSGKSLIAKIAQDAWRLGGFRPMGVAPNGQAAGELQQQTGIPSRSLESFAQAVNTGRVSIDRKTILVVDKANALDTPSLAALLQVARKQGAKVVLFGDHSLSQAVGRGGALAALHARIGGITLTGENRRQVEGWAKKAVKAVEHGKAGQALSEYKKREYLITKADTTEALDALVADWRKATHPQPFLARDRMKRNLMVASKVSDVQILNKMAQQVRKEAQELGRVSIALGSGERIYRGDRVLFTRGNAAYNVRSGEQGTVTFVEPVTRNVRIKLDSGKTATLPLWMFPHLQLGYAVTPSRAQALTPDHAFVYVGGLPEDRHLAAVQVACARKETYLYATLGEPLSQQMERARPKEIARDVEKRLQPEEQVRKVSRS